jgi:hypothetical protein
MLAIPSLLAAMTIAGAFWVGVLAARRLRDWGDGSRGLAAGPGRAALGPASDEAAIDRVRERLAATLAREGSVRRRPAIGAAREVDDLGLGSLRIGDVLVVEGGYGGEGDFIVEGVLRLREGAASTVVVVAVDGARTRWLVGDPAQTSWMWVEPIDGHGLRGEPPRQLVLGEARRTYALERRGQAAVAATGATGRPAGHRVATFAFTAEARAVAWVERWGTDVLVGVGEVIPAHAVSFLPGS